MNIGEPVRKVEDVPRPIPIRRIEPRRPEREPIPVRREPVREPVKVGGALEGIGMTVQEIVPFACSKCGRELTIEDGELYCPKHGVVEVPVRMEVL